MRAEHIRGLQALRCFACLGVVLSHLIGYEARYLPGEPVVPDQLAHGHFGTDLFFVLSGFIIAETTRRLHGSWHLARVFLWRRVTRIVPVYWVYLAVVLALWALVPGLLNADRPRDVLASVLLLPSPYDHVLVVTWTLPFELFFYLVFSVTLVVVPRDRLLPVLGAWAAATTIGSLLLQPSIADRWLNLVFNPLVLEFLAGAALALLRHRVGHRAGAVVLAAGVVAVPGAAIAVHAAGVVDIKDWVRVASCGGPAVLLVLGVVVVDRRWGHLWPGWTLRLGNASYSLFLGHLMVLAAVGRVWRAVLPDGGMANHLAMVATAVAAACLVALLSQRLLEKPVIDGLRRLGPQPPARA